MNWDVDTWVTGSVGGVLAHLFAWIRMYRRLTEMEERVGSAGWSDQELGRVLMVVRTVVHGAVDQTGDEAAG